MLTPLETEHIGLHLSVLLGQLQRLRAHLSVGQLRVQRVGDGVS